MESYEEQENSDSGSVPEFGAIFMSNSATKKECFRRKLFGLPPPYTSFVRKVKAGMILFLFEHEKRKLYGVFQAFSNGATDIVPHAFSSSGNRFSAQVRFTTIWYCHPLSEHDFRDAIKENYFSAYKFHFGLSKNQVQRLLWLFNTRKIKLQQPQKPLTGSKTTEQIGNSSSKVRVTEESRFETPDSVENEITVDRGNDPVILTDHAGFPRSDRSPSVYLKKRILETDNSIFDSQNRSYSPIPRPLEPQMSSFLHASSHRDAETHTSNQPVSSLYGQPYNSTPPHFGYKQSSPFRINHNPTIIQDFSGYPKRFMDSKFPYSRSQSNSFKEEPENMSVGRHRSLDVTNDPGDYIALVASPEPYEPSKINSPSLGARFFQKKATESTNYEAYNGFPFSEYAVAPVSFSRSGDLRREHLESPVAYKGLPLSESTATPVHFSIGSDIRRESMDSQAAYKVLHFSEDSAVAPVRFSRSGDLRREHINSPAAYKGSTLSESAAGPLLFSRSGDLTREKIDSLSFASSPRVSEYHFPLASSYYHGYEEPEPPYGNYEASLPITYSVQGGVYPSASQDRECNKHGNPIYHDGEGYRTFKSLQSDVLNKRKSGQHDDQIFHDDEDHQTFQGQNKRTSVFSRLTAPPKVTVQENDDFMGYKYSVDSSVDELMLMLHQSRNRWKKAMRKPKPTIAWNDDDENFNNTTDMEISRDAAELSEEETCIDQKAELIPNLNFRRRSEIQKTKGENEAKRGCIKDAAESGSLSNKQRKRRKLVRPTFNNSESSREKEINRLQQSSEENSDKKGNAESFEALVGSGTDTSDDTGNKQSQKISCEGGSSKAVKRLTGKDTKLSLFQEPVCITDYHNIPNSSKSTCEGRGTTECHESPSRGYGSKVSKRVQNVASQFISEINTKIAEEGSNSKEDPEV